MNLPTRQRERIERLGLEFLAEILETETRFRPENVDALAELGHVYTRLGRLENGLAVDLRLTRLLPQNPTVHYNLACSLCLTGRVDEAIAALQSAVDLGYDDVVFLLRDVDLELLRQDPRFLALVERLQTAH